MGALVEEDRAPLEGVLRAALEAAPEHHHARLAHADSDVTFRVQGAEPLTLGLRADGVRVREPGTVGEITIWLTREQAEDFGRGRLPLPAAITRGDIRYDGPVRKLMEVEPILRGRLAGDGSGRSSAAWQPAGNASVNEEIAAIETKNVHKSFGNHSVLAGVDLRIPEGMLTTVLGPSGTGKSVLLQHIVGLMKPDQGSVIIRGRPLERMRRQQLLDLRTEIGVMFQDGALFSTMDIFDNVAFPLRQHTNLSERSIREVVMDRLSSVGLADAAGKLGNELSGGMRKRAGLARALVMEPSIVLCDEPDSGLDPVRTALLGELLAEQHLAYGGTMIVITHNVMLVKAISEYVAVLWQGKVLESGTASDIYASESPFVQQFLAGETVGPLGMDA